MPSLTPSSSVYRFGIFEANPRSGELLTKGVRVPLQDKPFQLLLILLQAQGQVVTREQIRTRLWPERTFVEIDDSLNAAVKKLRTALNDSSEHSRFLETVPKVGYRFIPSISVVGDRAGTTDTSQGTILHATKPSDQENALREQERPSSSLDSGATYLPSRVLRIVSAASVLLALAVLIAFYLYRPAPLRVHSIAVLPLENLSGDPHQQYLADGMTDELITDLARLSSLSVISRTSAMQYQGTKKPLSVIARELKVDAVVEGSVVRSRDRVRITIQLVDTHSDRHLWAENYERKTEDLVQLQSDIAQAIADQVQINLTPADKRRLSYTTPVNPEAHEAYLKGLYFWNERTSKSLKTSIGYFEEAIKKDPKYALAYSGLADSYDVASDYDLLPPRESYSKAKAAVMKALELDPSLAQAHTTLADVKSAYEWDWLGAEDEFKRSLELNPGYANAHHWYAQYLTARGRHEEALAEIRRALELDPLSPSINAFAGSALYMARQFDESADRLTKMTAAEPTNAVAHYFLGFTYEQQDKLKQAISEFQRAVTISGGDPSYVAGLAHAYAISGNQSRARKICRELRKRATREYVSSYDVALVYAGLRDTEHAMLWLNRAYEEGDPNMNFLNVEPALDPLRQDSRFQDLLNLVGVRR